MAKVPALGHALDLVMFSGKGGVGKTTLACGSARALAHQQPQRSIMLVSTDPAHSLGDVLHMAVGHTPAPVADLPNLQVRALDAPTLLDQFRADYGTVLELLVERGSFIEGDDLNPVWDMGWPGLDELMALLEIQRLLRQQVVQQVVVDMAPSGHTLNLFGLMDFLDTLLSSLDLFQEKHRTLTRTLSGRYSDDEADAFIQAMRADLQAGRDLLQDPQRSACWIVGIPEAMSLLESDRFVSALGDLHIPVGGVVVNRVQPHSPTYATQYPILQQFHPLAQPHPLLWVPLQPAEPVGAAALDAIVAQLQPADALPPVDTAPPALVWPAPCSPALEDLLAAGRRLVIVGGKGGVGKTTVAAALGLGLADCHPDAAVRVISIDPAHSLGDALGQPLGHQPSQIRPNFQAQEVDADLVLDQFRDRYLWELADIMGGDTGDGPLKVAYGPEAWRQLVAQALPGIDEMLSLVTVMDLLEQNQQQLIVLDTAPTGHLLRFLAMPTALGDWLAWIFKLWIKYKDVVGRVEFMGRLRGLRKQVMAAQAKLTDSQHTEFIGVVQNQSAILAEAERLSQRLKTMGIPQHYIIHNRYQPGQPPAPWSGDQTIVPLPTLPTHLPPLTQVEGAAHLLLGQPAAGK